MLARACCTSRAGACPRRPIISYSVPSYRWSIRTTAARVDAEVSEVASRAEVPDQPLSSDLSITMAETKAFLEKELVALFETGNITRERYSPTIKFEDPLSKYESLDAYLLMVQLLKNLFNVKLELHSLQVSGPSELTARWTMTMQFWLLPWRPDLVFTGRSFYCVDPGSGLITSHRDVWDALQDSSFGSLEGVQHVLSQALQVQLTPDLQGPRYRVLRRAADYEIRQYEPYVVAQAPMAPGSGPAGGSGFNELAAYIFGPGNVQGAKMQMTTPVFTAPPAPAPAPAGASTSGVGSSSPGDSSSSSSASGSSSSMQFVMEPSRFSDPEQLPTPRDARIERKTEQGGYVAAVRFSGWPFDWEVEQQEVGLRRALQRDGLEPAAGYQLARYNEPTVPPFLRRNEVLIRLQGFQWP